MTTFFVSARLVFSLLVGVTVLIDRIVGQVHKQVVHVASSWFAIRLRTKACQTLFVDVNTHRIASVEEHINSQIILEIVNQVWLIKVVLDDPASDTFFLLASLDAIEDSLHTSTQENALTLGETIWLHDICLPFRLSTIRWLVELVSKVDIVTR